jgi:hypothetical protein
MHFLLNGFHARWVQAATPRHVKKLPPVPVTVQDEIDDSALAFFGRLD